VQQTPAPRWAPDPYRLHQLRFWDGERWTERVSDDPELLTGAPVPPRIPSARRAARPAVQSGVQPIPPAAVQPMPPVAFRVTAAPAAPAAPSAPSALWNQPAAAAPSPQAPPERLHTPADPTGALDLDEVPPSGLTGLFLNARDNWLPEVLAGVAAAGLIVGAAVLGSAGRSTDATSGEALLLPTASTAPATARSTASKKPARRTTVPGVRVSSVKNVPRVVPAPPTSTSTEPSATVTTTPPPTTSTSSPQPPAESKTSPNPSPTTQPSTSGPTVYTGCSAMRRDHAHGVGVPGAVDRDSSNPVTNFYVDAALYAANAGLDYDSDSIACER
jgi:hypothetical protein